MKRWTNKQKILCVIGVLVIILSTLGIFYYVKVEKEKALIKDINNHYNSYVKLQNNSFIYEKKNGEYKKVGKILQEETIALEEIKIETTGQDYFKIKDEEYYVYYQDTKKGEALKTEPYPYLLFNQNVVTTKKTTFYQNNKEHMILEKGVDLPLLYSDQDFYYVSYLNHSYGIRKTDSELKEHENTKIVESSYVSVIHYGKIYKEGETCTEDTCISEKQVANHFNLLKNNGFYTITLEELKRWLEGFIRLREKAILLTTDNEITLDIIKNSAYKIELMNEELPLKFENKNNKVTLEHKISATPRYVVKNNTSDADYEKMIKGEEVKEPEKPKTSIPTLTGNAVKIPVLNYHFFYDAASGESCNQSICLDTAKFEDQLKYLKDNGWKTLTMEEFRAWMYGEIELPAKSVLLTVDDGGQGTGKSNGNKLIPLLEKYQAHATIFLITAWYFPPDYQSPYLDIESHTNEMHTEGLCSGVTRGAQMLCSTKEQVLEDLKKSISVTGSTKAFCYPFYAYNNAAIEAVRESGFALGFQGGGYKASRSSNKLLVPRYAIQKNITLSSFIQMIH